MTVLQALHGYYDRMAARGEAELPGWSREKISFVIVLSADGTPIDKFDLRDQAGRKLVPRQLEVPAAVKRTAGISPNFLWDKSAYVLGRTLVAGSRTSREHDAFKAYHLDRLQHAVDDGLVALRRFLEGWDPARFDAPPFVADMLDANLIFQLDGDAVYLHQRDAAERLVETASVTDRAGSMCLVTGRNAVIERLHPAIRGVEGAQSSGASLVSFNLDAFTSYGKSQGDNAPTAAAAAFRYGAALNRMLDRASRNRVIRPIGDATVVFWADAARGENVARAVEDAFGFAINPPNDADDERLGKDGGAAAKVRDLLDALAEGRALHEIDPKLDPGIRFHVLGLAPNAARLSVRFWMSDSFGAFAERIGAHYADLAIEPRPWRNPPSVNWLLANTVAPERKFDKIPPLLAGEVTRAVLTGAPYPQSLLSAALMRVRARDDPSTGWHAAIIRAVLARARRVRFPNERSWLMSLEKDRDDPPYQLGRLFAALETAQYEALGKVNAGIRDRYFGAASATPASVFPLLLRGAQNHLGTARKKGKNLGWLERLIEDIADHLPPALPASLRLEAQGRFVIGYYHQRKARFAGRPAVDTDVQAEIDDNE